MSHLLIIVTASIAAPKSLTLLKLLKNAGYELSVIVTKDALNFVDAEEISKIILKPVQLDLFSEQELQEMQHINLSRQVDLVLIYPATADFINKMAAGIADNLALATILASNKKIYLAPAMNSNMWANKATQDSLDILVERGINLLSPNEGELACGEVGIGRVAEPEQVFSFLSDYFNLSGLVRGKKIIVTAGATIEKIDPVRYISNFSSGKQGVKIAEYFKDLGADVILIKGKTDCYIRQDLNLLEVESAQQMHEAVFQNLPAFMVIKTAAVADYRPEKQQDNKIKKSEDVMSLRLCKNPDILYDLGKSANRPKYLVGFAAESNDLRRNALQKLERKNCDVIIANDISAGQVFAKEQTSVCFFARDGKNETHKNIAKAEVAPLLLRFLFVDL